MTQQRLYLVVGASVPEAVAEGCREMCLSLAGYANEPVEFAVLSDARLKDVRSVLGKFQGVHALVVMEPPAAMNAAMSAADFIWKDDGRPDWGAMWSGFCELALYGGPPHRGEADALQAPTLTEVDISGDSDVIAEIRRGIWETTGLFAEPAEEPGWLAVTCHSRKMAAWLCASIILENVDARCEEERLFVPASPMFTLKNEAKSVITVLAKTNHYWQAHIEAQEAAAARAS